MRSLAARTLCSLSTLALAACDDTPDTDHHYAVIGAALSDDSPEAAGVLALLNHADTTLRLLDDDVRLDRRAAEGLIAYRDGADGRFGTSDDNLYGSIAEVDAVKWVGKSALGRLASYAEAHGLVPGQDDVFGVFDGVAFSPPEAEAALRLVNSAEAAVLDDEVGLDKRAVGSIVDARPIASMARLASLYYVGERALRLIREFAGPVLRDPLDGLAAGEDCHDGTECAGDLRCYGVPFDGSGKVGKCVDTYPLAGQGDHCDRVSPCEGELLCAGTTLWGEGHCVPPWMAGTFVNEGWREIRDAEVPWDCGDYCPKVTSKVVVYGLASVPVDIIVTAQIDHSDGRDLLVTLSDPNGDVAVLWDHSDEVGDGLSRSFVTQGISRDSSVNGEWTLTITDTEHGGGGWLKGWDLFIVSRWD